MGVRLTAQAHRDLVRHVRTARHAWTRDAELAMTMAARLRLQGDEDRRLTLQRSQADARRALWSRHCAGDAEAALWMRHLPRLAHEQAPCPAP